MTEILILGCGNLGSRHLQSLCQLNRNANILVVDMYPPSLEIAKKRANEIQTHHEIHINYANDIPKNKHFDLVINASNSRERFELCKSLLENNEVQNIIMEKILFTKREHYTQFNTLLNQTKTNAFVNITLTQMPFFSNLTTLSPLVYRVVDGERGLITKSLHAIHHFLYLTKSSIKKVDCSKLNPQLVPTKRKGYFELTGRLSIELENESYFEMDHSFENDSSRTIHMYSNSLNCFVDAKNNKALLKTVQNNWKDEIHENVFVNQSSLTSVLAAAILNDQPILLPTYQEALKLHLKILDPILEYLEKNGCNLTAEEFPFT